MNDDLWPTNLTDNEIVSPLTVLVRQCVLIGEKTDSHILGELRPIDSTNKGIRSYGLMVVAPGLESYRFPIMKIDYPLTSIYPLTIESKQIADEGMENEEHAPYKEWKINSPVELVTIIAEILGHPTTLNAIRSLLAESKARGYDPHADDIPF